MKVKFHKYCYLLNKNILLVSLSTTIVELFELSISNCDPPFWLHGNIYLELG